MKTSIFDMNFVLPPVVLMTEVVKDIPVYTLMLVDRKLLNVARRTQ